MYTPSTTPYSASDVHLVVRRLHTDLASPFARHWNGGDAFRTAFVNAMSMSFPFGEQFFIDSVRQGLEHLPQTAEYERLRKDVQLFIGQEATHRHLHDRFNTQLEAQGYHNWIDSLARKSINRARWFMKLKKAENLHLHELAITAAVEHLTAIMGDLVMERQGTELDWFGGAEERLQRLWYWHCAEEAEHKSISFDLHIALGGEHRQRVFYYKRMLINFFVHMTLQVMSNLWRDGSWRRWRTWEQGARFVFGRHGLIRSTWPGLKQYLRKDFHPEQCGDRERAERWLRDHQGDWTAVRGA